MGGGGGRHDNSTRWYRCSDAAPEIFQEKPEFTNRSNSLEVASAPTQICEFDLGVRIRLEIHQIRKNLRPNLRPYANLNTIGFNVAFLGCTTPSRRGMPQVELHLLQQGRQGSHRPPLLLLLALTGYLEKIAKTSDRHLACDEQFIGFRGMFAHNQLDKEQ